MPEQSSTGSLLWSSTWWRWILNSLLVFSRSSRNLEQCWDDVRFPDFMSELVLDQNLNTKHKGFYYSCALPWVCKNSFSIVIRAIDNTLLLIFLQYPRNDRLSNDTDATIIYHSCPKCVKPLYVYWCVCLQEKQHVFLLWWQEKMRKIVHIILFWQINY